MKLDIFSGLRIAFVLAAVLLFWAPFVSAKRLIATSPELTELLFQLGRGADVIATPQFSEFPPEAKKLPELGPLFAPSIERTLKLAADWVLLDAANKNASFEKALQALRQPYLIMNLSRVEAVFSESERLERAVYGSTGLPSMAPYRACWDRLQPPSPPLRFLAFAWLSPPILIGPCTFLSDLLSRVTGTNALPALDAPYPSVSEDWLTLHPVDVVYYLSSDPSTDTVARALFRKWWPGGRWRSVSLNGDDFSRASLTPLQHSGELLKPNSFPVPKECRAIESPHK